MKGSQDITARVLKETSWLEVVPSKVSVTHDNQWDPEMGWGIEIVELFQHSNWGDSPNLSTIQPVNEMTAEVDDYKAASRVIPG